MRRDRDIFFLALTLLPLAACAYAYFVWHSTGELPFNLSLATIQAIQLPSIPVPQITLPVPVMTAGKWLGRNTIALVLGITAGTLGGLIAVGTLADGIRLLARTPILKALLSPHRAQSNDETVN